MVLRQELGLHRKKKLIQRRAYGLTYKINRIKKPDLPLSAYKDLSAFKIFMTDVGLLSAMSNLDAKISKAEFIKIRSLGEHPDNMGKKKFLEQAGILMLANSIKKGEEYNLKTVMHYLQFSQGSSVYSPQITDMLAEDIEKNNRFKNLSLEDKIFVYETMEELTLKQIKLRRVKLKIGLRENGKAQHL